MIEVFEMCGWKIVGPMKDVVNIDCLTLTEIKIRF